jgi:hypothetical protein
MRTLVTSMLLPRITYGLPFVSPTAQQYAQLDALLYKPLRRVLAIPATVHRSDFAVTVGIPGVELQRDRALLSVAASVLRLSAEPEVREARGDHPALLVAAEHLSNAAVGLWTAAVRVLPPAASARSPLLQDASPMVRATLAARRLEVAGLLPSQPQLTGRGRGANTPWEHRNFNAAAQQSAVVAQRCISFMHARGYDVHYSGRHAGHRTLHAGGPRGRHFAPIVGLPLSARSPSELMSAARTPLAPTLVAPGPIPSLLRDDRLTAKLRTRLWLNRADFNAVRPGGKQRKDKPFSSCERCPLFPPVAETRHHVLHHCPAYAEQRERLRRRLTAIVAGLRRQRMENEAVREVLTSEAELMDQVMLGSPFVQSLLTPQARLVLLRATGTFYRAVHSIRPI